jgi:hypothetical protein
MSNINRHTGDNFGGIAKAYFAIHQEVAPLIDWLNSPVSITQAFLAENFFQLKFETKTGKWSCTSKITKQGKEWNAKVQMDFHQYREDVEDQVDLVGDRRLLLYIVTNNGDHLIIGSEEEGIYQVENFDSGSNPPALNSYRFLLAADLAKKPSKITVTA